MVDFTGINGFNRLPLEIRQKISAYFSREKNNLGFRSLCGAVSALSLKNYVLFSVLVRISLAYRLKPVSIYEGIIQCYLFLGFPRAIEGLKRLADIFKSEKMEIDLPVKEPPRDFNAEGHKLCSEVYLRKYSKLLKIMNSISPELGKWMIEEGSGKVLSRPGLSSQRRELVTVAALISEGVPNQLSAHIRGALNTGVERTEIESVIGFVSIWVKNYFIETASVILNKF